MPLILWLLSSLSSLFLFHSTSFDGVSDALDSDRPAATLAMTAKLVVARETRFRILQFDAARGTSTDSESV